MRMLYGYPTVNVMVTVMFDPAYWHDGVAAILAVNCPIEACVEVATLDETVALRRAWAVK